MIELSLYTYITSQPTITAIVPVADIHAEHFPEKDPEEEQTYPVLTFQRISTTREYGIDGAAGLATVRMQIDSWSDNGNEAVQLAEAVRLTLDGYKGTLGTHEVAFIQLVGEQSLNEKPAAGDNWIYRRSQDYMIRFAEATPNF